MVRGAWWAVVHRVTKSWTRLSSSARTHTYIPAAHRKENLFPVGIVGEFFGSHGGDFSQGSTINGDANPSHPSFFTPGRI